MARLEGNSAEGRVQIRVWCGSVARQILVAARDVLNVDSQSIMLGDRADPSQSTCYRLAESSGRVIAALRHAGL